MRVKAIMEKILLISLVGLIAYLAGNICGWRAAHITVAAECERLDGFFVGKKTFKCQLIESTADKPEESPDEL